MFTPRRKIDLNQISDINQEKMLNYCGVVAACCIFLVDRKIPQVGLSLLCVDACVRVDAVFFGRAVQVLTCAVSASMRMYVSMLLC